MEHARLASLRLFEGIVFFQEFGRLRKVGFTRDHLVLVAAFIAPAASRFADFMFTL